MSSGFNYDEHPCLLMQPRLNHPYGWAGHIPFAYLAIDLLRPRVLVELGTHSGNSYLAFCQAVAELGAGTRCTAVDTWEGDEHALRYGSEVLDDLRAYHDPLYSSFSTLSQKLFEQALDDFDDGSIDLLHIDGLHTYEAVRSDFEAWLPKLSERAVVLIHDSAVRGRDFGVWKFVEEIAPRYRIFQFEHSNGLAVVQVGANLPRSFSTFLEHAHKAPQRVRAFFLALARRLVDESGFPVAYGAQIEAKAVGYKIYLRDHSRSYDETRSVQRHLGLPSGVRAIRSLMPDQMVTDFLRIDFSETPGVYGLCSLELQFDGRRVEIDDIVRRVRDLNGILLPPRDGEQLRLVCFDGDPYVEIYVGDLTGIEPITQIHAVVDYQVVAGDPLLWKLIQEAGLGLTWLQSPLMRAFGLIGSEGNVSPSRVLATLSASLDAQSKFARSTELQLSRFSLELEGLRHNVELTGSGTYGMNVQLADATKHLHFLTQQIEEAGRRIGALESGVSAKVDALYREHESSRGKIERQTTAFSEITAQLQDLVTRILGVEERMRTLEGSTIEISSSIAATSRTFQEESHRRHGEHSEKISAVLEAAEKQLRGYENIRTALEGLGDETRRHGEMLDMLDKTRLLSRMKRLLGWEK